MNEQLENIQNHLEMMVTEEMKEHCGWMEQYSTHIKIFQILQGYNQALEELKKKDSE